MFCPAVLFFYDIANVQRHALWKDLSADRRVESAQIDGRAMATRTECRSETIVRSHKSLDIRYLAHSLSENIFRSG